MTIEKIHGFDVLNCGELVLYDTRGLAAAHNHWATGEFTDWVLPDAQTLRALGLLCGGKLDGYHWAATPGASGWWAWNVNLASGNVSSNYQERCLVRLVRASQCLDIQREGGKVSLKDAGIDYET